jgi:hypothetical protein
MVDGAAANCEIAGFGGGGGGGVGVSTTGGGGGGAGATFFLHPVAARNKVNPRKMMLAFFTFNILIMNLALYRNSNVLHA